MSLSQLIDISRWHAPLAANATNTTLEFSAENANIINTVRLAYGGSIRVLIYAPATLANPTPAKETVLINSAPSSNVFTVAAMTSEASYTTAQKAALSFNLVADGDMEQYGQGPWLDHSSPRAVFKTSDSFTGTQALKVAGAGGSDAAKQEIALDADDYCLYFIAKEVSSGSVLFNTFQVSLNSANWKRYGGSFRSTGGSQVLYLFSSGAGAVNYWDNIFVIPNMITNGGFEVTGSELVTNGDFANWTGDDPDNWSVSTEDANNYITEDASGARIVSDGSLIQMYQSSLVEIDKAYFYSMDIVSVTSGVAILEIENDYQILVNSGSVATHSGFTIGGAGDKYKVKRNSACDLIINNVSLKEIAGFGSTQSDLITNGGFDTDTNWIKGTGWSISGGYASCDGTQTGNTNLSQSGILSNYLGKGYLITVTIRVNTAGNYRIYIGGYDNTGWQSGVGTYSFYVYPTLYNTSTTVHFQGDSNFIGTIDNISVRELDGFWTDNATIAFDDSLENTGDHCLKLTATSNNGCVLNNIDVVDGQYYKVIFNGLSSATGHRFKFQVFGYTSDTTYYDSGWLENTSNYEEKVATFKVDGDDFVTLKGIIETSGEIIYFDDWAMYPVIEIDPSTETKTTLTDSYDVGKWGDNSVGSIHVDGGLDYAIQVVSGLDINPYKGSIGMWYRPDFDYNQFTDDAYLLHMEDFLNVYYDKDDYKFKFYNHNGSEQILSGTESTAQTFVSGTWIHVGISYDSSKGKNLYINGSADGSFLGDWTSQELPSYISIGCVSGTNYGTANGYIDDIHLFTDKISASNMRILSSEDYSNY